MISNLNDFIAEARRGMPWIPKIGTFDQSTSPGTHTECSKLALECLLRTRHTHLNNKRSSLRFDKSEIPLGPRKVLTWEKQKRATLTDAFNALSTLILIKCRATVHTIQPLSLHDFIIYNSNRIKPDTREEREFHRPASRVSFKNAVDVILMRHVKVRAKQRQFLCV